MLNALNLSSGCALKGRIRVEEAIHAYGKVAESTQCRTEHKAINHQVFRPLQNPKADLSNSRDDQPSSRSEIDSWTASSGKHMASWPKRHSYRQSRLM